MASTEEHSVEGPRKRMRLEEPSSKNGDLVKPVSSSIVVDDYQREVRAGITAFVNPGTPGFSGLFKQRYTDFLVNEILTSGEVLHLVDVVHSSRSTKEKEVQPSENLTDTTASAPTEVAKPEEIAAPHAEKQEVSKSQDVEISQSTDLPETEVDPEDRKEVEDIFGEKITANIFKLYNAILKHPNWKRKDFDKIHSEAINDKEQRTKAHNTVRKVFQSRLDTSTGETNKINITAALSAGTRQKREEWRSKRQAGADQGRGMLGWQELGGEYLHFTLFKENKDTMEIVAFLASQMRLHTKHFQFSGTKDRRGVTVQRISCFRTHKDRLAGLTKNLRNAKLGGFKHEHTPLSLGQLQGNEFLITLRDCRFPGDEALDIVERGVLANQIVDKVVESMKEHGFINHYGLQRFGSFATSTDEIGRKLLQGDLKAAVKLILSYSSDVLTAAKGGEGPTLYPSDDRKRALALETWEITGDTRKTLELLPRKFSAESSIVRHLGYQRNGKKINENDWQGALTQIQRNLRLMYVHAYQSFVWNTIAGQRWERYGNAVVEGDLVIVDETNETAANEVDESGEVIIQPVLEDRAVGEQDFVRARPITKEEAESGKYTIWDVVLPLPGFDVAYPANEVGKIYEDFMKSERGGGLDPHNMRRKWKDISLSGGYRKFLAKPATLEWEVKRYVKETEQLVKTDLDRLSEANNTATEQDQMVDVVHSNGENEKIAVILKMQLGSSQYATMALREMLKAGGLKSFKTEFSKDR